MFVSCVVASLVGSPEIVLVQVLARLKFEETESETGKDQRMELNE